MQYKSFENTVRKGEIARDEQFLLFPPVFLPMPFSSNCRLQTLSIWKSLNFVVWERFEMSSVENLFDELISSTYAEVFVFVFSLSSTKHVCRQCKYRIRQLRTCTLFPYLLCANGFLDSMTKPALRWQHRGLYEPQEGSLRVCIKVLQTLK